ncbi:MAG: hypothetical protein DRP01_00190 [Archaeoglobales archaeon]|nr:MAG: hypothetical protein DRP01_00190 [Archaeoglobales archaeon]
MQNSTDIFTEKPTLVGYIETNSGGILMADGAWEESLPPTTDSRISIDLEVDAGKIPVYAVNHAGKRSLLINIDDIILHTSQEQVDISDPIDLPEEKEEKQ